MTTGTQGWHADRTLLSSYLAGDLDAIIGASVELHVSRCATCRTAVARLMDSQLVERTWIGIRDAVENPQLPYPLRVARKLGLPESTAVLLASAASLRGAWLVGAFLALSFATLAAYASGGTTLAPFLLAAPLAPVLGVAAAYGPRQDPLEALVVTAPYGRTRLILMRTLGVLVSVLPLAIALGFVVPGPVWVAVAWLGPALALVPVMMALSSFIGPRLAAAVVALGWSGVVLLSVRELPATWPVEYTQQVVYLALAGVSLVVLFVRARQDRQIGAVL